MNFYLTEEQEMLRTSSRDFLVKECPAKMVQAMEQDENGYPVELWNKMSMLGWMGISIPEEYGGVGGSYLDLVLLLQEMGRACLPGPFFSTVVLGGLTILEAGNKNQKESLLSAVSKGKTLLTLALYENEGRISVDSIHTKAELDGGNWILNGSKLFVTDAHIANYIITPCLTREGVSLLLVDKKNPGVKYTILKTLAGDKQCEVTFDNVKIPHHNLLGTAGHGWDYIEKVLPKIITAKCAEMVGGIEKVLEMTISYAKERKQFGHPIGSFQTIQHYCANMAIDADSSKYITYKAASMLSDGVPCTREVAAAKAWVGQAFHRITALGAQIHGSIGLTKDHDFPLYYKRAKTSELMFGDINYNREIIAVAADL